MGVGPAEWEEQRGEERRGFTSGVRAAAQVEELADARHLRARLRKWPETWSCDGGVSSVLSVPRGDRSLWRSLG